MMNVEEQVLRTYARGAAEVVSSLCCPVTYDDALLALLPREIIERDYGCGDPSRYVRPGEVVLDLGSGGGKICYMAAQLVGPGGRVIGVDMNDDMLALARRHQGAMAAALGEDRVRFCKGRIQDLALDREAEAAYLAAHPVVDEASGAAWRAWEARERVETPMIADASVDLVISNCVLNLVEDSQKGRLVAEIFRVLKPGGRVAISDIVADAPIPDHLKADAELWTGCLSGAFQESAFLAAFRDAGFSGVCLDKWESAPWRVVEGIEFRSVTVTAFKHPVDAAHRMDLGHAVIYRGPFPVVEDELGGRYPAGERIAVPVEVYERLGREPFASAFIRLPPGDRADDPVPFTLAPGTRRPAARNRLPASCGCAPGRCC